MKKYVFQTLAAAIAFKSLERPRVCGAVESKAGKSAKTSRLANNRDDGS